MIRNDAKWELRPRHTIRNRMPPPPPPTTTTTDQVHNTTLANRLCSWPDARRHQQRAWLVSCINCVTHLSLLVDKLWQNVTSNQTTYVDIDTILSNHDYRTKSTAVQIDPKRKMKKYDKFVVVLFNLRWLFTISRYHWINCVSSSWTPVSN